MPRGVPKPPLVVYRCPQPKCRNTIEMFIRPSPGYEPSCNGGRTHATTTMEAYEPEDEEA